MLFLQPLLGITGLCRQRNTDITKEFSISNNVRKIETTKVTLPLNTKAEQKTIIQKQTLEYKLLGVRDSARPNEKWRALYASKAREQKFTPKN
jgi:hypothetical protein